VAWAFDSVRRSRASAWRGGEGEGSPGTTVSSVRTLRRSGYARRASRAPRWSTLTAAGIQERRAEGGDEHRHPTMKATIRRSVSSRAGASVTSARRRRQEGSLQLGHESASTKGNGKVGAASSPADARGNAGEQVEPQCRRGERMREGAVRIGVVADTDDVPPVEAEGRDHLGAHVIGTPTRRQWPPRGRLGEAREIWISISGCMRRDPRMVAAPIVPDLACDKCVHPNPQCVAASYSFPLTRGCPLLPCGCAAKQVSVPSAQITT